MKKLFSLISILILIFTLSGCGYDNSQENEIETEQQIIEVPVEVIPEETIDYIAELESKVNELDQLQNELTTLKTEFKDGLEITYIENPIQVFCGLENKLSIKLTNISEEPISYVLENPSYNMGYNYEIVDDITHVIVIELLPFLTEPIISLDSNESYYYDIYLPVFDEASDEYEMITHLNIAKIIDINTMEYEIIDIPISLQYKPVCN